MSTNFWVSVTDNLLSAYTNESDYHEYKIHTVVQYTTVVRRPSRHRHREAPKHEALHRIERNAPRARGRIAHSYKAEL